MFRDRSIARHHLCENRTSVHSGESVAGAIWVPKKVVLIEPMFIGYSHALFNASLIATASAAFPGVPKSFVAETTHYDWVRSAHAKYSTDSHDEEQWEELPKRAIGAGKWKHFLCEIAYYKKLLTQHARDGRLLLFCSVSPTGLLALKIACWRLAPRCRVVVIVHCLARLLWRRNWRPWNWVFNLSFILKVPHSGAFRIIALGQPLVNRVKELMSGFDGNMTAIDIPRIATLNKISPLSQVGDEVVFVFIGGTRKGFAEFYKISCEFASYRRVRFLLAGHVNSWIPSSASRIVEKLESKPISQDEIDRRVSMSKFAILIVDPDQYGLTASATFADAMSVGTPVIALNNAFIRYYFNECGHAGYLCDSLGEIVKTVRKIVEGIPSDEYEKMWLATKNIAERFDPGNVAQSMRKNVACS